MMKRKLLAVLLVLAAAALWADGSRSIEVLKKIGASDDEIRKIAQIDGQLDEQRRLAQTELGLLREKLQVAMTAPNPDLAAIEKLLRESAEWRLKIELAEIKNRIEVRKLLGDERWGKLVRMIEAWRENEGERRPDRDQPARPDAPRPNDPRPPQGRR